MACVEALPANRKEGQRPARLYQQADHGSGRPRSSTLPRTRRRRSSAALGSDRSNGTPPQTRDRRRRGIRRVDQAPCRQGMGNGKDRAPARVGTTGSTGPPVAPPRDRSRGRLAVRTSRHGVVEVDVAPVIGPRRPVDVHRAALARQTSRGLPPSASATNSASPAERSGPMTNDESACRPATSAARSRRRPRALRGVPPSGAGTTHASSMRAGYLAWRRRRRQSGEPSGEMARPPMSAATLHA